MAARNGDDGVVTLFAHGAVLRTWATVRGADEAVRRDLFERFHPLHNTGLIVMNSRPGGGWRMESWAGRALGGPRLDDGSRGRAGRWRPHRFVAAGRVSDRGRPHRRRTPLPLGDPMSRPG